MNDAPFSGGGPLATKLILPQTAGIVAGFCDIFDDDNARPKFLGGLSQLKATTHWYCQNRPYGRYRMTCEHGHSGQLMRPCLYHLRQFRTAVTFCPRCNIDPEKGHKCRLLIKAIS